MKEFFFTKNVRKKPSIILPSQKADLKNLPASQNAIVWFGHSSYFIQVDGKKILVDPVLSGHASPVKFTTRSFNGSDVYLADDMPDIDYLFISHDHWDHLDHDTVMKLKSRVGKVITGLGVGAHFERWGFDMDKVVEKDWNEEITLGDGFKAIIAPARHFSGRGFKRNGTLWSSFVFITPHHKLYLGGDSGYDKHFAQIGATYGPFDLAILENGQYDKSWKYIHMMPEEVVQAAIDLKAKVLFPVHWSKFALGNHDWDDSITRVVKEAKHKNVPLLHPIIGDVTDIDNIPSQAQWWEAIK
jgi:L-ascorbate metabolism protein UlaG (beta-lactamase superfamily)